MNNEIIENVSMRDVISRYHTRVDREVGRVSCPFHVYSKDKNLSYNREVFQCWVCETSGNVITFVSQLLNISNYEAVQKIAQDFNITLKDSNTLHKKRRNQTVNQGIDYTGWRDEKLEILAEYCRRYLNDERFKTIIPKIENLHQELLNLSPVESYYTYFEETEQYEQFIKDIRGIEYESKEEYKRIRRMVVRT